MRVTNDGAYLRATRPQGRGPRATEIMAREKLSLRGVIELRRRPRLAHHQARRRGVRARGRRAVQPLARRQPLRGHHRRRDEGRHRHQRAGLRRCGHLRRLPPGVPRFQRRRARPQGRRAARARALARATAARSSWQRERARATAPTRASSTTSSSSATPSPFVKRTAASTSRTSPTWRTSSRGRCWRERSPRRPGSRGRPSPATSSRAAKGKDCELLVGKNVKLSDDGFTALAEINGQVLLLAGKINVEPIYTDPRRREPPHRQHPLPRHRDREGKRGGRVLREGRGQHRDLRQRRQVPGRRRGRHHRAPGHRGEDRGQDPLRQEPVLQVHRARARGRGRVRRRDGRHRPFPRGRQQDDPVPGQAGADRRRAGSALRRRSTRRSSVPSRAPRRSSRWDTTRGARNGLSSWRKRSGPWRRPSRRSTSTSRPWRTS